MKVFVAGASGAIGRPTVRQLIKAGYEVVGMTRKEERAAQIRDAGAEAVVCDAFDADGLREAVVAAKPEVVVHLLTALPQRFNPRSNWLEPTNRIRVEGTRNLVAAATAAGARRMVAESIAFVYRPEGAGLKSEEDPIEDRSGPGVAVSELERQVREAPLEGLILRYGWLYGPGTHYDHGGQQAEEAKRRRFPVIGGGTGVFSFLHAEDAAAATVAAVERGAPGTYNVVDDEPAPMREWIPALAAAIGAPRPLRVPVWLARLVSGKAVAALATRLPGASNARARRELGWEPRWPTWRTGFGDAPR
jgi:2-alkyl-3-oxoalkanoate reductase